MAPGSPRRSLKSDSIVKVAPNDPFTAWAIIGAMMDVDANQPVTKHFSTVFWPKDMPEFENELIQPCYLEKIISWGGALGGINSTLYHGSLQASGIDVISLGPKFSISILGSEAFRTPDMIDRVACLTAKDAASFNMESCGSARFHYVQATADLAKEYARRLYWHIQVQDPALSTFPRSFPTELRDELEAGRTQDDLYYVVGGKKNEGGVVVSLTGEMPDFFPTHKVVIVIPFTGDPIQLVDRIHPSTQTVGIYPESLKDRLRDPLVAGAASVVSFRSVTLAETCVFAKQSPGPFQCGSDQPLQAAAAERTFSRSYGAILPSSLTRVLPIALVFSTRLPVSDCGTGTFDLARHFSRRLGSLESGLRPFIRCSGWNEETDLPVSSPYRLRRV